MSYMNIKRQDVKLEKKIGQGGFCLVFQAKWCGQDVAAKRLLQIDKHEVEVLSRLDHPNIVKLIGLVDENFELYLILELCKGGSLRSYLSQKKSRGERLSTEQFFDWTKQAAWPIQYLQQRKIVHKDIKSPNYLIADGNILKLADFGLAKNIDITITNATERASYPWMAPELLKNNILSPTYDIYAYGVVVWELWTTDLPFEGCDRYNIVWRICRNNERPPIPTDCPNAIADLLTKCWKTDWHKRPSIDHILTVLISAEKEALAKMGPITVDACALAKGFGEREPSKLPIADEDFADNLSGDCAVEDNHTEQLISAENAARHATFTADSFPRGPSKLSAAANAADAEDVATNLYGDDTTLKKESVEQHIPVENEQRPTFPIAGPWMLEEEFGQNDPAKLAKAIDIAVSPNETIAVVDFKAAQIKVYSREGEYKFSLESTQGETPETKAKPWNVTISAKGNYYVTEGNGYVKVYDVKGAYKSRWVAFSPENKPSDSENARLHGLTKGNYGEVLVGDINRMYISKHRQNGAHIASLKVNIRPYFLAVTPRDTIIVSEYLARAVQIVDYAGQVLNTLRPPSEVRLWEPMGICFHEGVVFTCNYNLPSHGICCFSVYGEYLGSISVQERAWSLVFAKASDTFLVACGDKIQAYSCKR